MTSDRTLVLDREVTSVEDELRLPRPPGVIRRFWARHPLGTDILIAVLAFLLAVPGVTVRTEQATSSSGVTIALTVLLAIGGCVALVWRRRWPILVFAATLLQMMFFDVAMVAVITGPAAMIGIYSLAVYRSVRASWIVYGVACTALALNATLRSIADGTSLGVYVNVALSAAVVLLVGLLIGINVGNRRRYLEALIDRSRQLLVERDQQAQLAASAERTRIAREMHDIVSHSLTVIVALSEGAAATADPAQARNASRAAAATARDALAEMRVMLGVLRDDRADDDAPLAPTFDASLTDIVESARRAGHRVTLTMSGVPAGLPAVHLAIVRITQESLTNAMRYGHDTNHIRVQLHVGDPGIELTIENDGARADEPSQGAGLGLRGLQERVAHLGGTIEAGIVAPNTWRVHARIPQENRRA
ncbi:MAG: ATP-binding protein [Actinobacteria bacterium]|nr:ATP-binding protein [Actinomycetota bacterium]